MYSNKISLMGIPVANMDMQETIDHILKFIEQYTPDQDSQYIGTLNVEFLSNAYGWNWKTIRHPELLSILRNSFLITPDGTPLVWLSRLLGSPLKERIAGSDLFPSLAAALAEKQGSLFLLGGEEHTAKVTALILESLYPGLKIVGIATPPIHTGGLDLENSVERDNLLVEQINSASPDILFISLGNPKQEIWFNRVKKKLQVPISIGIGGTYMMTIGAIPRAPIWMQNYGLEWLYRLFKEPGRLFKRYFIGGLKLIVQTTPLIIYNSINSLLSSFGREKEEHLFPQYRPRLYISKSRTLALIPLPPLMEKSSTELWSSHLDEANNQDIIIWDFTKVQHFTLGSLAELQIALQKTKQTRKPFYILGMSGDVAYLLKLHRLWDLVAPYIIEQTNEVVEHILGVGNDEFFESIFQEDGWVNISIFGALTNNVDYEKYINEMKTILSGKNCKIDLTYSPIIENLAFTFFIQLRNLQKKQGKILKFVGLNKSTRRQFKLASLRKII